MLYCFYEAHDPAVHLPARCVPETACHLVTILAYPQILFAHVITVMDPEIRQEQQVALLVFHKAIQECLFLFFGQPPMGGPVRLISLCHKLVIAKAEPFQLLHMKR